ncbi:FAD-dependent oxidoreductase [Desulfotalea psychrophila]|uniref:Related to NADH oxidase n=1 Tax=Desulfotalea psychrophila (strain LSv54 / DSM 12343) TaxID=177439 RepID=Q6AQU4_DESPS|nr:FAD-dependent oxidoreductase [Desulfotalea psychrophila]CAG35279.1 related to NADH oxidase [Desulfotalea psychrophila LSv54]
MAQRVLIIGAVALGPKVACRLRRIDPDAEITVLDRDKLISYGGCGIPYYVGGDVSDIEGLRSTQSHTIRDSKFFGEVKGIDVRTQIEAIEILRKEKQVRIRDLRDNSEELLSYDKLVFATGASPIRPPFPGADLPNVSIVSNLHHAEAIKKRLAQGKIGKAVVIGAGAIGIEMAEALTDLWGVETTIIEMADQVLPQAIGGNLATVVQRHLEESNVEVLVSERVSGITKADDSDTLTVSITDRTIDCDIVILSTGIRPNTELAKAAGLAVGQFGGLLVDRRMRTSDPHIYAGGDCVEVRNLVSGANQMMPLGSLANRQGRIIATNINGGSAHFPGTVGTFCIKVFELGVATAGLTARQAKAAGFDPVVSIVTQADRAHFYPTYQAMYIALIADRNSRKVLGIEAVGKGGDAVKARVDAVASLLHLGVDVAEISNLEAGYAPPFASAMDIVNNAGNVLDNILNGFNKTVDPDEFLKELAETDIRVIDVRGAIQAKPYQEKFGERWLHFPQDDLRTRYTEIPTDEAFFVVCDTGTRSYEGQVVLAAKGITNTRNIQGGLALVKAIAPEFI